MLKRFSTDMVKGDVCRDRISGLTRKNCLKDNFWSATVAGINSKIS